MALIVVYYLVEPLGAVAADMQHRAEMLLVEILAIESISMIAGAT